MSSGRLAHAYLFSGPAGVGKRALAVELAKKVLKAENLAGHPDFIILDQDGEILIAQVREFIERLRLKPFAAAKKIALINNAQNLNRQSANALLKTLEEPPRNTVIILISEEKNILPTIFSRCLVLNFNLFGREELSSFAKSRKISANGEILELSFGSPGRLVSLSGDGKMLSEESVLIGRWKTLGGAAKAQKILAVGEFAEMESEKLEKIFFSWLMWEAKNHPRPQTMSALLASIGALKKNFNKKLILQNLFLNI